MNLTARGISTSKSVSSTSSTSIIRWRNSLPYSVHGSSLKFFQLEGLKPTRDRTWVMRLSARESDRRRAQILHAKHISPVFP